MTKELKYTTLATERGWIGILASTGGLLSITLPQPSDQEARQRLGDRINQATRSAGQFDDLMKRLQGYFSGHRAEFPDKLDLLAATPWQREVWQAARLIPYGETKSYLWLARQLKRPLAARAAGQALSRNPLPIIIPCHRVIASDGKPGGYSSGLEMKRYLLRLEGTGQT